MASSDSETLPCIDGDDFMNNGVDVLKLNSVFLMSLFEESHCEEYDDDEQLENLIRSLEAEINPKKMIEDQESVMEGQDCSESSINLDDDGFARDNMELVMTSSSVSSYEFNLYMDSCNQMDVIDEFGGVSDDHCQLYYGCYNSVA